MNTWARSLFWLLSSSASLANAQPLKDRCKILIKQIGELELVRLKNNRAHFAGLIREEFAKHFEHARASGTSFVPTAKQMDYLYKFLEMQKNNFNEWHAGTGLFADIEVEEITIRRPNGTKDLVNYPFIHFRYLGGPNVVEPSSYIGRNLKQSLSSPRKVTIVYNPLKAMILSAKADGLFLLESPTATAPKIMLNERDFFAIDTMPMTFTHEKGHHTVYPGQQKLRNTEDRDVFEFTTGDIRANQPSDIFHSDYLREETNNLFRAPSKPFLGLDEIYTYWLSVNTGIFNLKQALSRTEVTTSELQKILQETRIASDQLSHIGQDSIWTLQEVGKLLAKPNSPLNVRSMGNTHTLEAVITPFRTDNTNTRTDAQGAPESLKVTVSLPMELDKTQQWADYERIIGGKSPTSSLRPLPDALRAPFVEHLEGRIKYVKSRTQRALDLSLALRTFTIENPTPTREQIRAFVNTLR